MIVFLGLHDGGFLTGPHRPPERFPQGGVVRVRTIGVPANFFEVRWWHRNNVPERLCTLITWVNTRTKHGQLFGYSYQYAVILLSSRHGPLVGLLISWRLALTVRLQFLFSPRKTLSLVFIVNYYVIRWLLGNLVICHDIILFHFLLIKKLNWKGKGKTAANSLDDKGFREQYKSKLSRI